jgi:parallel beta-helix repeat protein
MLIEARQRIGRTVWRAAWLLAAAVILAPAPADAKTLYVDSVNGNDATSYDDNSQGSPWRSIGRAAWGSTSRTSPNAGEAARAGDVVRIAAGLYATVGTDYRFGPAYNPANSGTPGNPIRFEAVGTVNLTFSSGRGPMIGADGKNYIEWSGFTISEATAPTLSDTGPVVFAVATGGSIENCVLNGNPNWTQRVGDNYDGIRLNGSAGQRIVNNRIAGFGGQTGEENHAGIKTYFARNITIENNEIDNNGAGIYMKGNDPSNPVVTSFNIRFNQFTNNAEGIRILLIPSTPSQPNLIHQNIFRNNRIGLNIQVFDRGATDPRHAKILNNTFVDNTWGLYVGGSGGLVEASGHMFWNNIVVGGDRGIFSYHDVGTFMSDARIDMEHNLYFGSGAPAEVGNTSYSLASWKSASAQESTNPASIQADPMFVNAAGRDYRLRAGSPAAGLGRASNGIGGGNGVTIPAGAYITGNETIGRSGSASVAPGAPGAPGNFRIIR